MARPTLGQGVSPSAPNELPLRGIRVLDCSRVLAGPLAAMRLADLGADVVKLEPTSGDESRAWGPPYWGDPANGISAYFSAANRNKRSLALDLSSEAGTQILDKLADRSDVLVHNFRPSTAGKLKVSAERLHHEHPHLVVAAIGGFPGTERSRERPAYDLIAQAMSGLMSITGEEEGGPMKVGVALIDIIAGLELAMGALALLAGRSRGNTGGMVEVSLVEVAVSSLANVLANWLASGEEPKRQGNAHPNIVPYQTFAVADGHIAIAVGNDAQFGRLLQILGMVDPDGQFSSNQRRIDHREDLIARLSDALRLRSRHELVSALVACDVPVGPVLSVSEAVRAMDLAFDGRWIEERDGIRIAPDTLMLNGTRTSPRRAPPALGQHTEEVLSELGLSSAEVAALRESKLIR